MELNIGTFATVLERHGAPASESAKPLLADGRLPHNQRFLIACLKLIWRLFLICWFLLATFVARLWSWLPFDYSNMPDYDKAFQGIILTCLLILIGSQWKSIYFQIHVASTVVAWFALDSDWPGPFEQSSSLNMSTIGKAFCTGFTCAQSDSNRDLN